MKDSTIREHLAQAEQHVAEGADHIARQKTIVAELEHNGETAHAQEARELLATMQALQRKYIDDRARLAKQLRDEVAIRETRTPGPDPANPEEVVNASRTGRTS